MKADGGHDLGPADLALLAEVAYPTGHLDVTIESWERAHAACRLAGEDVAAAGAAVRLAMHLLFDTALMAPVRGWLARAERLLEGKDESAVNAWFAVVKCYERMLSGDQVTARTWSRQAVEVGERWDRAATAIGRIAHARLLILAGEVEQGLALLDEAGVATVSGDLDPLSTGVVYCELVCALQGLAQYDLAEQWTEVMERWCETSAVGSLRGRCRVHRAEILRLRGAYDEAEVQALLACEELRPYLRRELGWPLNELGRIRLHKGDLTGAEDALLAAHQAGWDPQPGLARLLLAQGDAATAAAYVRDALERPLRAPWKEQPPDTDLRRASLLETQVEVEIAAGDVERARPAADELERVALRFESKALAAAAATSRGRVQLADGEPGAAEGSLSTAVRLWHEVGAPYEEAVARLLLADAHATGGQDYAARLERRTAGGLLDALRAAPASSPAYVMKTPDEPGGSDVFCHEGDYWTVVFGGRTVRVRDLKGMRHLSRLLAEPGREFHVLDLVALEGGSSGGRPVLGDAGEMLDAQAKRAYRRRLAEIEGDLDEADALGDAERAAQASVERDFLLRELAGAVGLGGRDRRAASASERARAGVTRAVRQAVARIGEHHPSLGEHLDRTVRTGTYCAYVPAPRVPTAWTT
ncbi:MAG: Transcriptional regulator, LuxR family [uncultured Friedmanniella sp.]|uniref:Transcriptional regulator, LuxR family n=1 Tax=uncultured Friedmanniella sp. TaxID=335381 RepID=A0A6J4KR14_9ACTN|nr:MAG: Transcriptional regulator, LuxR family [uncultured Friedmanniella sp.]